MGATDGDGHPPDPHRERIAPERPGMKRFYRNTFIEAKIAKPAGAGAVEHVPVNRADPRANAYRKRFQRSDSRHIATDYQ